VISNSALTVRYSETAGQSRPAASVLYEAERLVAGGVKEIMVISQDTSAYGVDTKYATSKWAAQTKFWY